MNISNTFFLALLFLQYSCHQAERSESKNELTSDKPKSEKQIAALLDSFNEAAGKADYEAYFNYFADDATFLGTDATEHWDKKSFMVWAKPFFDKKTTWNFKALERHIYMDSNADIAWFDELLDTQMKICRGSGVVVRQNDEWKVKQYVLSMTIPNSQSDSIIAIKAPIEDSLLAQLRIIK